MSLSTFARGSKFFALVAIAAGVVWLAPTSLLDAQAPEPIVWTQWGPQGAFARLITTAATCPSLTLDGTEAAMQIHAAPNADFPVTVCDAPIPDGTRAVSIGDQALPAPKKNPQRIAVIGDTGCRIKDKFAQSCNDPQQFPFAQVAASAAAFKPDLIIHVGDYNYRETACPLDVANCAGSPYGDNWAAFQADWFAPGAPLFAAAPLVLVRGNHEICARNADGWFRLLDPRALPTECSDLTEPYAVDLGDLRLVVLDVSMVDDYEVKPDQVTTYREMYNKAFGMVEGRTWLLQHDPMYVFGHLGEEGGKEKLFIDQLTLQEAINNRFPPEIEGIFSGHIHLFQVLSFDDGRPPQMVVGNSGTLLDPPVTTPLAGLEIGGTKVAYGMMLDKFGFVTLERSGEGWAAAVRNVSGGEMDKCVLSGKKLLCGQAALPKVGGDFSRQTQWLTAMALVGGAVLLVGVAMGVRAGEKR